MQASPVVDSIGVRPYFIPSRPEEQIIAEYLKVWSTVYEPRRFLERTYRFFLGMRPTRTATARRQGETLPAATPKARVPLRQKIRDSYMVPDAFLAIGDSRLHPVAILAATPGYLEKKSNPDYRLSGYLHTGGRHVPPPGPYPPAPERAQETINSLRPPAILLIGLPLV